MPVTLTATQLVTASGMTPEEAARLLPVASTLVTDYAGTSTPDAILDEATVRCASWLWTRPADGMSMNRVGDREIRFAGVTSAQSPLRFSGARALLAPWRKPRASAMREID